MKLFLHTAIVFFGTLLAAGLVALGETGAAEVQLASQPAAAVASVTGLLGLDH